MRSTVSALDVPPPSAPDCLARFYAHVAARPDQPALRVADRVITYAALAADIAEVAAALHARGVGPEVVVGLAVERHDFPVGLMAILTAGGTYLPLDPALPRSRRELLASSAGAALVLDHLPRAAATTLTPPAPDQRAYVMFTSGTSGPPKGVEIEHGALAERYVRSPYYDLLAPGDVLAAITAVSWNPSVFEVLYTLASGATIALADANTLRDPAALAPFLDAHAVTFMRAVPSLWQALLDGGWRGKFDLKAICHGERLDPKLETELAACTALVLNTYGSTEASVFKLDDPHVHVFDADLAPTPPDEVGEIYISGPVLARGYLGDPDLTASRFVTAHGRRYYRTGDIARVHLDHVELLGRRDSQVKIRGQRVELGEVEHALARHPLVREVVASADAGRLVVHLVADTTADALRADLANDLADHLVPSVFVFMTALPRTPHGKVDRRALPAVPSARPALATAYRAPLTPTEVALAGLFCEALGLVDLGIDDDFLALGGDSLRAAQIAARIKQTFALDLPLVAFFKTPTVHQLAAIIDARGVAPSPPITVSPVHERLPLSYAQERLWFLHQLAPDSCAYSLPSALAIAGPLDRSALEAALRLIVRRHATLRTTFTHDDGVPTQHTHDVAFALDHVTAHDPSHLIAEAARRPFDLTHAPLIRATLFERGPDDHVLFVNMHHIASDGWSNALFRRELGLAYNALSRDETPPLPPLPIQYVDFARWQRHTLAHFEPQLAYWRAQLADLEPLPLPTDHTRPAQFTHRGARVMAVLPPRLQHALKALARDQHASLYMLTLAAFKALLYRYTGTTDIAVGSPIAGRSAPETQDLIGFFVNALVMRDRVDPLAPFTALLDQVKATVLSAFEHQDLPFERLVAELNPPRDLSRHPLIQTMFALQTTPIEVVPLSGLTTTPTYFDAETTRFDCELHLWERADGLHCHLVYNTDLFDAWRMRQWLTHFEGVLEAICVDPTSSVASLDFMSPSERATLRAWNTTDAPYPEATLHDLFREQAARTPDAIAIAADHHPALTYRELDARSDALAAHLCAHDLGPHPIVAVTLGRSPDYIIAALAILKLGGAYLPIDPTYPAARRQAMIDDAGARYVVTTLPALAATPFASPRTRPDDRAYVIYTSGSTGRPHGVEVNHGGVVNLARWHVQRFAITPGDRATFIASPAFDAVAWELWPHLIAGACIHIPDDETRVTPRKLVAWLRSQRIDVAFLSTPLLEACAHESFAAMPLRALLTGGDRLRANPGLPVPVYNGYGPTECSVVTTLGQVHGTHRPDIGRPLPNVRVYVLDAHGNDAPIGIAGDLHIGGVGLARGYLGQPELTAARFVDTPRGRLYRSGDRARWRPDGTLDFLGRADDQIKLRGIRIELGEIDATLLAHPDVREAVTIVRDDHLVSYVVARPTRALEAAYVAHWQALYDAEYAAPGADAELDTSGWMSSFTGQPIPAADMREWAEQTVAAIERYAPERILEIGTGTGLLLHRLARRAHYVGSDFSRGTITRLQRQHPELRLVAAPAHDLTWLGDETFDTVVLNSIVQYFPSADYLAEVLTNASAHVSPGGRIFIGDVRNWDTLEAFHRKVARDRGRSDERVHEAMLDDKELVVSPGFFEALRTRVPRITAVAVRPKRGRALTEMALFRYDVTLYLDVAPHVSSAPAIAQDAPAATFAAGDVLLTGLVDARHDARGCDLEALATLAARFGRHLDLRLGPTSKTIDALFTTQAGPVVHPAFEVHPHAHTTDPLRRMRAADLLPRLREHLARTLPEAYLPAAITLLDALPLTTNGKLDRRRLPSPRTSPATPPAALPPTQRTLMRIFSDALALPCLPTDNFFALGGHSLLAVQVLARIGQELGVDLPLATLFERPTIAALAERIDRTRPTPSSPPEPEPTRLELTPMDVNFHYGRVFLKGPARAWYQVLELALPRVDVPRLEAAIIATMNRHPLMRARLSDANALGPDAYWAVGPHLARAPLVVHDLVTRDDVTFAAFASELVANAFPLDEGPLFRFVLARRQHGDRLFVRYNHGAVDASGLGAAIDTLFAHYLGRPDPTTRSVPYRTHELLARHEHHTTLATTNELAHYRAALRNDPRIAARWWRPRSLHPTPIAPDGGDPSNRDCERVELSLSAELSDALRAAALRLQTSLDRLLLVGLLAGAARWNDDHHQPGRIEAYWAVNLRPPRDFQSIVANLFAWSRVRSPPAAAWSAWRDEVLDGSNNLLVRGALDWITFVESFHQRRMPRALRWLVMWSIKHSAPSIVISNTLPYGQLGEGPLARAMGVTHSELHSRYGFTDRPILILGERDQRLFLRVIHPRRLFDAPAAQRFLATLRDAIATEAGCDRRV